jgi:hypothetical protein
MRARSISAITLALAFLTLACGTAPVPTASPSPPVGSAVPSAYAVYYTDFVELTGHFNDPESSDCVWTEGDFMQFDVSGAPKETAVFSCQNRFVVTAVAKP